MLTCLLNNERVAQKKSNCTFSDDFEFCRYEEESCLSENEAYCSANGMKNFVTVSRDCANDRQDHVNAEVPGCTKITKLNISTVTTCYCDSDNCNRNCKAENCKTINQTTIDNAGSLTTSNLPTQFQQCDANCSSDEEKLETTTELEDTSTTTLGSTSTYTETKQNVITDPHLNDGIVTSKSSVDSPFIRLRNIFLMWIALII